MLTDKNRKKLKKHMPAILAGLLGWSILWVFTGTSCWLRAVFGIPCPGCGSTRAVFAVFSGHMHEAVNFHPLIFVTLTLIAIYSFAFVFRLVSKIDLLGNVPKKWRDAFILSLVVVYLAVYAARMVLLYPKSEPMTYLAESSLGRLIGLFRSFALS